MHMSSSSCCIVCWNCGAQAQIIIIIVAAAAVATLIWISGASAFGFYLSLSTSVEQRMVSFGYIVCANALSYWCFLHFLAAECVLSSVVFLFSLRTHLVLVYNVPARADRMRWSVQHSLSTQTMGWYHGISEWFVCLLLLLMVFFFSLSSSPLLFLNFFYVFPSLSHSQPPSLLRGPGVCMMWLCTENSYSIFSPRHIGFHLYSTVLRCAMCVPNAFRRAESAHDDVRLYAMFHAYIFSALFSFAVCIIIFSCIYSGRCYFFYFASRRRRHFFLFDVSCSRLVNFSCFVKNRHVKRAYVCFDLFSPTDSDQERETERPNERTNACMYSSAIVCNNSSSSEQHSEMLVRI